MKIILTGGAGFIGSHVFESLRAEHDLIIVDDFSTGSYSDFSKHLVVPMKVQDFHIGRWPNGNNQKCYMVINDSLRTMDLSEDSLPKLIIHLAALTGIDDSKLKTISNISATLTVLETARFLKCPVIFASSAAVYGSCYLIDKDHYSKHQETGLKAPQCLYGMQKFNEEMLITYYSYRYNIPYVILRFSNVYGARQRCNSEGGVIAIFKRLIDARKPLTVFGDGSQIRDFVHVSDVVKIIKFFVDTGISRDRFNVSTGIGISILDVAKKFCEIFYDKNPAATADDLVKDNLLIFNPIRSGDVPVSILDNTSIKEKTHINFIPFADGLRLI